MNGLRPSNLIELRLKDVENAMTNKEYPGQFIVSINKRCLHGGKTTMLYLNLSGHSMFFKKRFGTSPEKHCLTAMPCRLFQGNLNPKRFKPT